MLGTLTLRIGFTIKLESVLGKKKLALNVLILSELRLKKGFNMKVEMGWHIEIQLFVEALE